MNASIKAIAIAACISTGAWSYADSCCGCGKKAAAPEKKEACSPKSCATAPCPTAPCAPASCAPAPCDTNGCAAPAKPEQPAKAEPAGEQAAK